MLSFSPTSVSDSAYVCARVSHSVVTNQLFATPWTVACQAPLAMKFSRQEYWSGLLFPSPVPFPTQELNPGLLLYRQILYLVWATMVYTIWDLFLPHLLVLYFLLYVFWRKEEMQNFWIVICFWFFVNADSCGPQAKEKRVRLILPASRFLSSTFPWNLPLFWVWSCRCSRAD